MLLVLVLVGLAAAAPPVLPGSFVAAFANPPLPGQPSSGTWWYDAARGRQLVEGGNQASCGRVPGRAGLYCDTYEDARFLYLVFPLAAPPACCRLPAPGLLRPDWLAHDNATRVGVETVNGRACDVWLAQGASRNYMLWDPAANAPCRLDDGGFNWTFFAFQAGPFDPALIDIPVYCKDAPTCKQS